MSGWRPDPPPPRRDSSFSDVYTLSYYHPELKNMEQVKQTLLPYSREEGSFLLRNSISKQGYFTISVVHSSGIKHFNVERTTMTYYLKDIQFTTLDQLVRYYSHTDVPNKELIRGVRLKHAITRSAPHVIVSRDDQQAESANPDIYIHPEAQQIMRPPTQSAPQPPMMRAKESISDRRNQTTFRSMPQTEMAQLKTTGLHRSQTAKAAVDNGPYAQVGSLEPHADRMIREMQQLDLDADADEPRCDCGLPLEKSGLPRGWSIHISQDEESFGEIYFMSPSRETHWALPLAVCLELDADQQDFIRDLIYEFEQRTKRTARAKMTRPAGDSRGISSLPRDIPADGGYIKPSGSASSESSAAHLSRPQSMFPPELPAASKDRSPGRRSGSGDVVYMCMNGSSSKM